MNGAKTYEQLLAENESLRWQLYEATETIQAIRTGQIDALVVQGSEGHELYTLKTADHTYRIFIETMNEGAVTLNREGLILYSNSAFAAMVDLPLTKVFGLRFREFVAPDMQPTFDLIFTQSWVGNQKEELSIQTISKTIVPCLLSVTPMQLDGGECLSLILTDLTVQKETQQLLKVKNEQLAQTNTALEISNQALNRSNSNLQQFAYVASHDLQEPLRKVQQFGDLLKNRYAGQLGDGVNYLERMQSAASRMSTLIRDLLSFSRISTQQDTIAPVSLTAVFKNVLTDLDLRIQETNAVIRIDPLPGLQGDQSQLEQLFQNLVSNALKFRRPNERPVIHVTYELIGAKHVPSFVKPTRQTASYHRIDVIDNGIGFEEKYVDRIFQVFQRLHGKNEFVGTGIGLAICEKVAANHGGAISASSQPGQGATFSVYLPQLSGY